MTYALRPAGLAAGLFALARDVVAHLFGGGLRRRRHWFRHALDANCFLHLAFERHHVRVDDDTLSGPAVRIVAVHGSDHHEVGLVADERLDAVVLEVNDRLLLLLAVVLEDRAIDTIN